MEVKEIHALARNTLNKSNSNLSSSTKNWPDFFCRLGPATEEMIDCFDPPFKFKMLAFNKSSFKAFGDHLLGQPVTFFRYM